MVSRPSTVNPQPSSRLSGRTAIITGAGRGLGRAIALLFAREGANVAIATKEREEMERVVAEVMALGAGAAGYEVDVACEDSARVVVDGAAARFGRVDILVNNAAIFYPVDFLKDGQEDWQGAMQVNFYGALYFAQACARHMVEKGVGGRIINISSVNGFLGADRSSHYNCAKGALDQLTRCLAVELAPHGILVNGIAPGFMDTAMAVVEGVKEHETPEFREFYVNRRRIPLARSAQPEEVAQAALFLALPENTYMTGQTLVVDGGLSITF